VFQEKRSEKTETVDRQCSRRQNGIRIQMQAKENLFEMKETLKREGGKKEEY